MADDTEIGSDSVTGVAGCGSSFVSTIFGDGERVFRLADVGLPRSTDRRLLGSGLLDLVRCGREYFGREARVSSMFMGDEYRLSRWDDAGDHSRRTERCTL